MWGHNIFEMEKKDVHIVLRKDIFFLSLFVSLRSFRTSQFLSNLFWDDFMLFFLLLSTVCNCLAKFWRLFARSLFYCFVPPLFTNGEWHLLASLSCLYIYMHVITDWNVHISQISISFSIRCAAYIFKWHICLGLFFLFLYEWNSVE